LFKFIGPGGADFYSSIPPNRPAVVLQKDSDAAGFRTIVRRIAKEDVSHVAYPSGLCVSSYHTVPVLKRWR